MNQLAMTKYIKLCIFTFSVVFALKSSANNSSAVTETKPDTLSITESGVRDLLRYIGSAKIDVCSNDSCKTLILIVDDIDKEIRSCSDSSNGSAQTNSDTIFLSLENATDAIVSHGTAILPGVGDKSTVIIKVVTPYKTKRLSDTVSGKSIWDIETPFSRIFSHKPAPARKKRRWPVTKTVGFKNFYVGAFIPENGPSGIKTSWEIGLANLIGGEWHPGPTTSFSLGLGFGFSQVNISDSYILDKNDGALIMLPVTEEAHDVKGHIENFHFTIPLMFTQRIAGTFGFSLGAELHLNTYTTANSSFKIGEEKKVKTNLKGLHQRMATPSLVAILGWVNSAGIYVRYNPSNPWKEGYGPDFQTWGIGLSLAF